MHDHARRVAGRGIDLLEGREALLGELRPGPAADHLHPVRRRRAACLLANPPHALGERWRSEEHMSELQSLTNLVCRLLLEKKKKKKTKYNQQTKEKHTTESQIRIINTPA